MAANRVAQTAIPIKAPFLSAPRLPNRLRIGPHILQQRQACHQAPHPPRRIEILAGRIQAQRMIRVNATSSWPPAETKKWDVWVRRKGDRESRRYWAQTFLKHGRLTYFDVSRQTVNRPNVNTLVSHCGGHIPLDYWGGLLWWHGSDAPTPIYSTFNTPWHDKYASNNLRWHPPIWLSTNFPAS